MKRRQAFRRWVAAFAAVSLVAAATPLAIVGPAAAGGYHGHGGSYSYRYGGYRPYYGPHYRPYYRYGHHGYRYGHRYRPYGRSHVGIGIHGHGSGAAVAVGALGAGLLLGHLLTRPPAPRRVYAAPTVGYGKTVARDCKPTTGHGVYNGRPATFGGTFCYDARGQGYVVPGSAYFMGYRD